MPGPRQIVPLFAPVEVAVAAAPPNLVYHGGPVIGSVQVVPVFWGAYWASAGGMGLIGQLEGFFDFILTSSVIDLLAEYSTPTIHIGHGNRQPSVRVTSSEPGTNVGGVQTVSDAQIQQALQTWIAAGTLPPASGNTLYFVYLPPNVVSTLGTQQSCTQYCGYHNHVGGTIFYALEPYVTCAGCTFGSIFDTLTKVSSHELCESITDPALNAWWDPTTGNEIGDICNTSTLRLGGYLIQSEWSNAQSACAWAPPPPAGGWASLGGGITSDPFAARNADGRLETFARGTDNALWHIWQTSAGGGWSGWASLGGGITTDVVVASNHDGRLEAFARGTDNALWHIWQTSAGGGWSGWASLGGGITTSPCVGSNADGRLEAFARGTDNALWHIWQTSAGGGWSGWSSLGGGITTAPAVATNHDGRLEAFARGTDNALWHIWQTSAGGGWSGWSSLGGGITSDPYAARNVDGRLEVFARGTDNALWHIWQTSAGGGWSGWSSLGGGITTDPVVATNHDGRLEAFARGTDNALWHIWQTSAGGGWSTWASLGGGVTSNTAATSNLDGRLEAFVRGTDNALWHRWQVTPGGGWN
jgi:hypothetical protein